jgi:hypothetical protein
MPPHPWPIQEVDRLAKPHLTIAVIEGAAVAKHYGVSVAICPASRTLGGRCSVSDSSVAG